MCIRKFNINFAIRHAFISGYRLGVKKIEKNSLSTKEERKQLSESGESVTDLAVAEWYRHREVPASDAR